MKTIDEKKDILIRAFCEPEEIAVMSEQTIDELVQFVLQDEECVSSLECAYLVCDLF